MSYEFHMVDMGGIDLVRVNETVVEGLYDRLEYGVDSCGNVILYNWFFADVAIAPSPYSTIEVADSIVINGVIRVTSDDRVSIIGIDPPQPSLIDIEINDNGIYNAVDYGADGFRSVKVSVESGVTMDTLFSGSVLCNSNLSIDLEAPYTDYLYIIIQGYVAVSGKNYNVASLAPCDIGTGESNRIGFSTDTSYAWLYFNTSTNLKFAVGDSATKHITKIIGIKEDK